MSNLNEITHYDDPVDQWAAQREFELRDRRYDFYRQGGVVGIMERLAVSLNSFQRTLVGAEADLERVEKAY